MSQLKEISSNKCFGGQQKVFTHHSKEMSCDMNFAIFLPDGNERDQKYPVLYYLSGLTCNELNCVQKGGFQRYAAEHGIIVVCPDTSPRNIEGLDTSGFSWDFGYGAGFYIDAVAEPFKKNFRMYSYVTSELIDIVNENFPGMILTEFNCLVLINVLSIFSFTRQAVNNWSLDGRTWSSYLCLEESRFVPQRFSIFPNNKPSQLCLGQKSIYRLPRNQ